MKTTYIEQGNYFLTENRTSTGRLQLAEGRTEQESRRAMLTLQRDLATYGQPPRSVNALSSFGRLRLVAVQ